MNLIEAFCVWRVNRNSTKLAKLMARRDFINRVGLQNRNGIPCSMVYELQKALEDIAVIQEKLRYWRSRC